MNRKYSGPMLFAAALAATLVLGACGSSGGSPSASGGGASNPSSASGGSGSGSLQKITVGAIPIPDTAPLYMGIAKGYFKDEGLDVKVQAETGGADAVTGVVSGTYTFAFGNYVSAMVARDKGIDLRYVANGDSAGGSPDFQAVVVPEDSPIKTPKDLTGKTVTANQLSNINDTTIRAIVDRDGGDSSKIKFVAVAFPNAVAAVENKQVDAATVNPYLSSMSPKLRVITYNFYDFDPNLDVGGYFTKASMFTSKPDLVKKFTTAINKSIEYAQAHPDEVRAFIPTYTKFTPEQIKGLALPKFEATFHRDALQKLADAALKYGTLTKPADLSAMLPPS